MIRPHRSRSIPLVLAILVLAGAGCTPGITIPRTSSGPGASSVGPGIASPRPTPTPTPAGYEAAIEAFVASVIGGLTYRTSFEGRVAGSADLGTVEGRIDTDGTDFAARYDYDFRRDVPGIGILTAGYREVDGVGYLRIEDQHGWDTVDAYTAADAAVPFRRIRSAADVRLVETSATEDGEARYTVEITGAVVLHPRTIPGLVGDERIRHTTMLLILDQDGRPVEGTWDLDATGRVGRPGQLQQLRADLDLVFSRIGDEMGFEAP